MSYLSQPTVLIFQIVSVKFDKRSSTLIFSSVAVTKRAERSAGGEPATTKLHRRHPHEHHRKVSGASRSTKIKLSMKDFLHRLRWYYRRHQLREKVLHPCDKDLRVEWTQRVKPRSLGQ